MGHMDGQQLSSNYDCLHKSIVHLLRYNWEEIEQVHVEEVWGGKEDKKGLGVKIASMV